MNYDFPKQNRKLSVNETAKKFQIGKTTAFNYLKELGVVKPRKQYEGDAQKRREIAFKMREKGMKFREIAEELGISINNAQQLVRRYKQ